MALNENKKYLWLASKRAIQNSTTTIPACQLLHQNKKNTQYFSRYQKWRKVHFDLITLALMQTAHYILHSLHNVLQVLKWKYFELHLDLQWNQWCAYSHSAPRRSEDSADSQCHKSCLHWNQGFSLQSDSFYGSHKALPERYIYMIWCTVIKKQLYECTSQYFFFFFFFSKSTHYMLFPHAGHWQIWALLSL